MAGVRPDEARRFYEDDEDPARVLDLFDRARKGRTRRPARPSEPIPWGQLAAELRRALREVRLRDRLARVLRHAASAIERHRVS